MRDIPDVEQLRSISIDKIFSQHVDGRFLIDRFLRKDEFTWLFLKAIDTVHRIDSVHHFIDFIIEDPFELSANWHKEKK